MKDCQQLHLHTDDEVERKNKIGFGLRTCSASSQNLKWVALRYLQRDKDQHPGKLVNIYMQASAWFPFESKGFAHFPLYMTYTNIQMKNTIFSHMNIRKWEDKFCRQGR